jgi:hypothetical protein
MSDEDRKHLDDRLDRIERMLAEIAKTMARKLRE